MIRLCAILAAVATTAAPVLAQTPAQDAQFDAATDAVRDREFRRAIALFEPLAEADIPDAQFNLAVLLRQGRGRPQNHVEALYWSALSLLSDGAYAQDMVDELLDSLPPDARQDVVNRLLERLMAQARDGRMAAPRKLARVYMELMTEPDVKSGYIWFSICHALGENDCTEGRDDATDELEPEDLIEIQAEASEIFAGLPFSQPPTPKASPEGDAHSMSP